MLHRYKQQGILPSYFGSFTLFSLYQYLSLFLFPRCTSHLLSLSQQAIGKLPINFNINFGTDHYNLQKEQQTSVDPRETSIHRTGAIDPMMISIY